MEKGPADLKLSQFSGNSLVRLSYILSDERRDDFNVMCRWFFIYRSIGASSFLICRWCRFDLCGGAQQVFDTKPDWFRALVLRWAVDGFGFPAKADWNVYLVGSK